MMFINFPVEKFAENGKSIEPEVVAVLYDRFDAGTPDFWGPGFKMPYQIRQGLLWNSI